MESSKNYDVLMAEALGFRDGIVLESEDQFLHKMTVYQQKEPYDSINHRGVAMIFIFNYVYELKVQRLLTLKKLT